jgi:hypothetical protein
VHFPPEIDDIVGPFYDRSGERIDFERFAKLKFREEDRVDVVGLTDVEGIEISTVWLGWREGVDAQGRPRIFETAAMTDAGVRIFGRYATEEEAVAGHAAAVDQVQSREGRAD